MDSKLIECKAIDVPKANSDSRTFSRDFAIKLADSIKIDGMLVPIVVRPNPDAKGRYILVAGRHRYYATKAVLKEQFINAIVMEDMDEEDAEFASTIENLWRNPLNKAQHALGIKRWMDRWMAKHDNKAEVAGEKSEPKPAPSLEASHNEKSGDAKSEEDEKKKAKEEKAARSKAKFDETVAAATGQSVGSARRAKRIAEAFTEEQLEVFTQMSVNQTDMTTIAKIKDEGQRAEVVNLIATGKEPADAIKEVMADKAPVRDNSGTKADREAKAASAKETAPELTDDQWFEQSCGEKAAMLGNPAKFKADAILYRQVTDARHTFRTKAKKAVKSTRAGGVFGAFTNIVNRLLSISHPKHWLICGDCKGTGQADTNATEEQIKTYGEGFGKKPCPKCYGGGYMLKTEEYL